MIIKVLGSAAGGGFPQWNCNGRNSRELRAGRSTLRARTQSSLAVSSDGSQWVLLNASPDIRQQIEATRELHPRPDGAPRNSPIAAVVLTNGDVDHVAGLLSLREGHRFAIYATARVLDALAANPIFNVLDADKVWRVPLALGETTPLSAPHGPTGLSVEAFPVPGKIALYLEDASAGGDLGTREGDTIGLAVTARNGARFYYIPACAAIGADLKRRLSDASLLFFDGTLYSDDELIAQGLASKTGARMGHICIGGPRGSLAALATLKIRQKVFVHINNSNPILREDSAERAEVERAGWIVAHDGMEVRLP